MKLSVVVVARNEEQMLMTCLESVKWVDEIVIVDNGSTDQTIQIGKKYTDKIFTYEGQDYSEARNIGMAKSAGDWVLYVDADERVLQPLQVEIQQLISDSSYSAYAISRINIIYGQEVNYGSFWPDRMVRLFKRSEFKTWVGTIHEHGTFNGPLGYSKNSFLHLTHRDLDQVVTKTLRWSNYDARLRMAAKHPPISWWRLLRILVTELFHQGVIRKGFFAGTVGTVDALLQTFSMVITYIRLWQMQQPKPLAEIYKDIDTELINSDFKY